MIHPKGPDPFAASLSPLREVVLLEFDPRAGWLDCQVERFGDAVGAVPEAGENRQGDEVPVIEVFPHGLEGFLFGLGGVVRDDLRPSDGGLLPIAEQGVFPPAVPLQQLDLFIAVTESPTELLVVADSVVARVDVAGFENHQLFQLDEFGVPGLEAVQSELAVD